MTIKKMNNLIFQKRGFALVVIIVAVLIVAIVAFGAMSWKGQIQQSQEIKNKAIVDLEKINNDIKDSNRQIQNNLEDRESADSLPIQQNSPQTSPESVFCGYINFDQSSVNKAAEEILKKSFICINKALIDCSPSSFEASGNNKKMNIYVNGQGELGCNVSLKYNGETITCPMPFDYIADIKKKFAVMNYDGSIVRDLMTDMYVEMSDGNNKDGHCTVTK
jgi:type II secretory pathway pseudopilin PulG